MTDTLRVTIDKSHLVTIGEKLYGQSVELIRELVNNAYDADATTVEVSLSEEQIVIRDNGTGMDLEGLKNYFNIGSQGKLLHNKSEKFGRSRIGQFGIGKFAALTAAKTFEVETQKDDFRARVIFDKESWQASFDSWELPLTTLTPDLSRSNGTTITLRNLSKKFDRAQVERRLIESVPLMDPDFDVLLDGFQVLPRRYQGKKIPILEGTAFGVITGELVVLPASASTLEDLGIEVKVKKVTVKREFFGMENWGKVMSRVRGEIHADFLPVTSDRSGFIVDSDAYQAFFYTMSKVMSEVKKVLSHLSDQSHGRKTSRVLKDALERIRYSLSRNPELSPFGPLPMAEPGGIGGSGLMKNEKKKTQKKIETISAKEPEKSYDPNFPPVSPKPKSPRVKALSPNAVVKKVKFGDMGVSCCIDSFGPDGPESFTENGIIYMNQDHPLYREQEKKPVTFMMHVTRLLAQEIALMMPAQSPREACDKQSQLLKAALAS